MDRKDLQLLEIISNNCRISNTEIGQMLNLSKNSIISRKEKLIENNIYTNNNLIIDSRVLGYTIYQLFIQLDSNIINKEKILDKLKKYNRAIWINTFIGSYNLQIIVDAKNSLEFDILK
ncbi:MAG: Lrp/AsnC family transcriptional regulator, partial [Nanoarchaeales archaeon]|nr:Lrp/AsnC family transcriptional regulator [Nanoarchaeales archaeon]